MPPRPSLANYYWGQWECILKIVTRKHISPDNDLSSLQFSKIICIGFSKIDLSNTVKGSNYLNKIMTLKITQVTIHDES